MSAAAAPESSARLVAPPASSTCAGLALTVTLPIGSPRENRCVWKAALSAFAAWPLSSARTPRTVVPRPRRTTFALSNESDSTVRRLLPTFAVRIARREPTCTRKLRRATRVPPARNARPPLWLMRPAAVAGSIEPPVIGKATPPPRTRAGLSGLNATPFD